MRGRRRAARTGRGEEDGHLERLAFDHLRAGAARAWRKTCGDRVDAVQRAREYEMLVRAQRREPVCVWP
jgi:hypothetical protein